MTDLLPGLKKRLEKTNLANPFEGEEKEKVRATKVKGLGEEAFWSAGKMGGVLYGLKHQIIVRIGFGIQRPGTALSANKLRQCNTFSVDLFPGGTRRFWLWRRKGKPAVIFRYWAAKNDSVHEETLITESPINLQRAVKT